MPVHVSRPDVGTLLFRLYNRPVHPELVSVCADSTVGQERWSARLEVCAAGHTVTFRHPQGMLCEVTTSAETPLPKSGQILTRRLKGQRNDSIEDTSGLLYHVSYQVEKVEPELFLHLHEELQADFPRAKVAHQFPRAGRMAPAPLSMILTDIQPQRLVVHSFHTFPDNCAVVKTQSLFELLSRSS